MRFTPNVILAMSEVRDGPMTSRTISREECRNNRQRFLNEHSISLGQAVLVQVVYNGDDFCRYQTVTDIYAGDGILTEPTLESDALFTQSPGVALVLPLADCIGMGLYDRQKKVLGVSHLGRHNLEQNGGTKSVEYMSQEFGSDPRDIQIYLSAAVGESYPLHSFNNRTLHDVAIEQLAKSGILRNNIMVDERDTATDQALFSHSEFLKGNRDTDGRHALVAMMRE